MIYATDLNPIARLNELMRAGGIPIGFAAISINEDGQLEQTVAPLNEDADNQEIVEQLRRLVATSWLASADEDSRR